jgi:hypothetical protein
MFSVMTWNLENFERPAANAEQAVKDRHKRKLQQIAELITSIGPALVGGQEVLADHKDLAPRVFDDLRKALVRSGTGACPSAPILARSVGWLARGRVSNPTEVAVYPERVPATTIDDDNEITAITASKRGALTITYTRGDGLVVRALITHLKSKLRSSLAVTPNIPSSIPAMMLYAPASTLPLLCYAANLPCMRSAALRMPLATAKLHGSGVWPRSPAGRPREEPE